MDFSIDHDLRETARDIDTSRVAVLSPDRRVRLGGDAGDVA